MPNNIIKYASGGACSARGKSNAIAPAGPSPGNTPTNVPSNTPRNPYRRLSGEAAGRIPCAHKKNRAPQGEQNRPPSKPLGNSAFNSTSKNKWDVSATAAAKLRVTGQPRAAITFK